MNVQHIAGHVKHMNINSATLLFTRLKNIAAFISLFAKKWYIFKFDDLKRPERSILHGLYWNQRSRQYPYKKSGPSDFLFDGDSHKQTL